MKKQNKKKYANPGIGAAPNQNPPTKGTSDSRKFNFTCKICEGYHLNDHFPFMEYVHRMMIEHGGNSNLPC